MNHVLSPCRDTQVLHGPPVSTRVHSLTTHRADTKVVYAFRTCTVVRGTRRPDSVRPTTTRHNVVNPITISSSSTVVDVHVTDTCRRRQTDDKEPDDVRV